MFRSWWLLTVVGGLRSPLRTVSKKECREPSVELDCEGRKSLHSVMYKQQVWWVKHKQYCQDPLFIYEEVPVWFLEEQLDFSSYGCAVCDSTVQDDGFEDENVGWLGRKTQIIKREWKRKLVVPKNEVLTLPPLDVHHPSHPPPPPVPFHLLNPISLVTGSGRPSEGKGQTCNRVWLVNGSGVIKPLFLLLKVNLYSQTSKSRPDLCLLSYILSR